MLYVDLAVLRTLVAVLEEGTFERAAIAVGRTQAAVSQQMRKLEEEIDAPLFIKKGRSNLLTAEGQKLVIYARRMLSLHEEMLLAMHSFDKPLPLKVAASADISETILPDLIRRFTNIHPHVTMQIQVGRSPELLKGLAADQFDLTIGTRWHSEFQNVIIRTSPIVWIAARDYRVADGPIPLILSDEPSIFRRICLDALERAGIRWHEQYASSTLAGIKAAVKAGLGITARSIEMVDNDFQVLGTRDSLPQLGDITFYASIRDDSANPAAKAFFRMLGGKPLDTSLRNIN